MMTTVLKKGAPSRSFPSRQRKLGPAPFASFEDLSDEMESPAVEVMPPHVEEDQQHSHQPVTATSSSGFSQPTSGLQTPSTPRIDISCASSSTPPSEDSDKELFQGGLGFAFHEEGTEELRSSTEELDLGEVDLDSEEEKRQKRIDKEELRRGSHPANVFSRRKSSATQGDEDFNRKPSAHTLFLDNLLARHTRHASFGANDYTRPGAISSLSAHSSGSTRGRSPSPHKMMLETSFCGFKPIPTKSMDIPDSPPKPESSSFAPAPSSPLHTGEANANKSERSLSIKSIPPPVSPSLNSSPSQSRRPSSGRRSVSPFKMMLETSFCGSKPIPNKSFEVVDVEGDSPPTNTPTHITTSTTAQVHHSPTPSSPKSSDHWRPVTPRSEGDAPSPSESSPSQSTAKYVSTPNPAANLKLHTTNVFKWPESEPVSSKSVPEPSNSASGGGSEGVVVEEAKFLHQSESFEDDGDLPYVPTTLPQEKPSLPPIAPSSQRFNPTHIPLQRPKANRPANPANINDYIAYSEKALEGIAGENRMKISLPREDSTAGEGESPKKVGRTGSIGATNWADFAEMGLRSPRDLRRKLREENGDD